MKIHNLVPWFASLVISLTTAKAQGEVNFGTKVGISVDAKITDCLGNGVTSPPYAAALQVMEVNGSFITIPQSTTTFRTGAAVGYVVPLTVIVPGRPMGTVATLRVVAFAGPSFEQATARGVSNPVTLTLGGGLGLPPDLVGLQGFSMCIPEPTTMAVFVFAGATLLLRWRFRVYQTAQ